MRNRTRLLLLSGLSVAFAAVVANFVVLFFDSHSEQDSCAFGPISNADYRAYLTRAKAQLSLRPSLYFDDLAFSEQLVRLFDGLTRDEDSVYARLAAMHAVLRAIGAEYRNVNGNDPSARGTDPFVFATTGAPTVSFNYLLDVNRIWIFTWPREAWVVGVLAGPLYARRPGPMYPKHVGGISFVVNGPDLAMWPRGYKQISEASCPPIPDASTAKRF